jgi:hypothetical protein
MIVSQCVECVRFPCTDVRHEGYSVPHVDLDPVKISILLISEAAPQNPSDGYYAAEGSLYQQTTLQAFADAGLEAGSIWQLLGMGIYFTSAVKCAKTGYGIRSATIRECSRLLEREIALFPNLRAFLLMGDVAIQAANSIALRRGEGRAIPAGSTYKIRGGQFTFQGKPAFPSYLQAGPSFGIEKSKREMIAQDIRAALALRET